MFKKLFKKKDEFELFLEESNLEDIFYNLDLEEKQKFKDACYIGFSINSDGEISSGKLISFRDRNKLIYMIPSNLIYRKEYDLALKILECGIPDTADRADRAQYHITYALAYEKLKDTERCNYHCWEAINLLHHGSYAYERLIKNYVKSKEYEKALEVCNIVLSRKDIFDKPTWKSLSEYAMKRKNFILKKIEEVKQ